MRILSVLVLVAAIGFAGCKQTPKRTLSTHPIVDGYFADPSIVKHEGKFYIFATIDPWGGNELAVFETSDLKTFEQKHINWPTKEACTSPTSGDAMVWAPSVVKGLDGNFYMYVSVGSEVWAGKAAHPLGPWENMKADGSPLIPGNALPGYHMIDADCFIDTNGQIFLYWGSGLNWVNGKCFVAELESDMFTFKTEAKEVTPPNFFEGAFMFKKNDMYYLMYSDGKAIDHTYKVRYSKGETPYGPWTEGLNSPILQTSADSTVYGPGHHSVFTHEGVDYILHHRIFPQKESYVLRQLYLDVLSFDKEGNIESLNWE